ncbi:MAG: phosphotransferase, partial [Brevefilum sp.]
MARTVQGLAHTWQVSDTPIGSGDAGEVYAVTRLEGSQVTGVMKKPARVATGGTIQRQAGQIAQEARALALLDGLPASKAHPPRLLDQAADFTHGTANYFIVSETAPGEDLNTLLADARQTGQPFPRRVIMTVLDALFDMFSRAHQAGVLWNDVKLEHIYWHNPTGRVGVIDWGNALFLNPEGQGTRPRWEDYQQMVDTLGTFLQSAAPDLFVDLGWDEFLGKTLDSMRVSTLARRIAYQQQVIALQVMENQSLIRVVLTSEPTLEGLRKISDYQQNLVKIGAPWYRDEILQYCRALVETALAEGDIQTAVSATALVWEVFDNSLDLPWHLLREYCRHTDI